MISLMKTIAKINPEKEYESANKLIDETIDHKLSSEEYNDLKSSVSNLMTATKILMEREDRRRGKNSTKKDYFKNSKNKGEGRGESKKLPSEKYPNIDVTDKIILQDQSPICDCCGESMSESGLYDTAEKLEVLPKKYIIERHKRAKYNCKKCHGSMKNTPAIPSIVPTSNYGDSFIIDVTLSKYCDLIPIERYTSIAGRENLFDLPANTMIGLTHHLANYLEVVYEKIKDEILSSPVLLADETPHRMLEGDKKKNWYLWGFFGQSGAYFEAQNTRSGEIARNLLKDSKAKYLVTDGYGGYTKAIREVKEQYSKEIIPILCNAHAYRYFKDASITWESETKEIIILYKQIFELDRKGKKLDELSYNIIRKEMIPLFNKILDHCQKLKNNIMPGSGLDKAINYYINHFDELTCCTKNSIIPLENNLSERNLRPPVIGRKIWLGTHSKRGAKTNAILFSIVQSCKMCNINPRNYFPWIVKQLHYNKELKTPYEYSMETQ